MSAYVDEYDIYDDVDYDAIARQLREDEDREAAANETERRTKTSSPSTGEGWDGGEKSLPSSPPMSDKDPFAPNLSKDAEADNASSTPNESNREPSAEAEGKKAAERRNRKKENRPSTPNDPAPEFDLHYEPLTPEQQAKLEGTPETQKRTHRTRHAPTRAQKIHRPARAKSRCRCDQWRHRYPHLTRRHASVPRHPQSLILLTFDTHSILDQKSRFILSLRTQCLFLVILNGAPFLCHSERSGAE